MNTDADNFVPQEKPQPASNLRMTPVIKRYWSEIANWTLILSTISAVFFLATVGQNIWLLQREETPNGTGARINLILIGLMLFGLPIWFAVQFALNLKKGVRSENQSAVEKGMVNLKNLYLFIGILAILYIGLIIMMLFVFLMLSKAQGNL